MARTQRSRGFAVQQVQEVAADGVVVGFHIDALAVVAEWYQYSSIEPSEAISLSAMSRAPGWLWSSFSGDTQPSTDTPVRITSIGCAEAAAAPARTSPPAGRPRRTSAWPCSRPARRVRQLAVHQQVAISSNSQVLAKSRMS
jgi:hypothetical protein